MHNIYTVKNEKNTAVSELLLSAPIADAGQPGWTIQTYSAAGIDYAMLIADEHATTFPLHDDPNKWFGFVVEGTGELHLGSKDTITETISYKVGDIILFDPNTYHGWRSMSQSSKLMFVKVADGQ